jgi:uncharacterized protein YukE
VVGAFTAADFPALDQAVRDMEGHHEKMLAAVRVAQRIHDDIDLSFKAASATAFLGHVEEWITTHNTLAQKFERLYTALKSARDGLQASGGAGGTGVGLANAWGGGGAGAPVYAGLTGQSS